MSDVRVLVLRAAGINCDEETVYAWQRAGAVAERVHIKRLIEAPTRLSAYQILTIPGGFSYGDDIAGGKILGNQLVHHLGGAIRRFVEHGGLVLGICNGFQVLVRAGLLPGGDCPIAATLALNDSGRYEDRWVRVRATAGTGPFLEKGEEFFLPVAHAEGKVVIEGGAVNLSRFEALGRIGLRYVGADGDSAAYPANPNGSIGNAAGLVDATGCVLGLMPHPERAIDRMQFPDYLRDFSIDMGGLKIFRRAVAAVR